MRPDDITVQETFCAMTAYQDHPDPDHDVDQDAIWVALAAQNALRDERVRRAERERIAQEIKAMETPRSTTVHYTEIARRVCEGGDTNAG